MKSLTTKKIAVISLLTAMSVLLSLTIRFPLVPAVPFMHFDPKDLVIAIGGFIYGPFTAFLISVFSSLLEELFTGKTIIDVIMNIISSASFACTAAWLYRRIHTKHGAIYSLAAGTGVTIIVMLIWNYIMDPFYLHVPRSVVVGLLPAIALFNFLKYGIDSVLCFLVYKPVVKALRSAGLVPASEGEHKSNKMNAAIAFAALTVAAVLICVFAK